MLQESFLKLSVSGINMKGRLIFWHVSVKQLQCVNTGLMQGFALLC